MRTEVVVLERRHHDGRSTVESGMMDGADQVSK